MADWRQIQARIRKAKASGTPAEQLIELHQRTRDAMVAFELARFHEKNGDNAEAARWYTTAAQQFRRAQWRVKAEEALSRLGAEIPPRVIEADRAEAVEESPKPEQPAPAEAMVEDEEVIELAEQPDDSDAPPAVSAAGEAPTPAVGRKRHRRGRRGGRKHRRQGAPAGERTGQPERSPADIPHPSPVPQHGSGAPAHSAHRPAAPEAFPRPVADEPPQEETVAESSYEPRGESAGMSAPARARAAEPALSSRMAQLESRLRRLLACSLASLKDADQAPAGPGVLLLSDSDQVTHYYVESCHTLRIGIGNLLRGGRGSKDAGRLKQVMAENLGISESRVSKYMSDHCVVRWLQLDEGAPELAHFAIAVLHPVVNE